MAYPEHTRPLAQVAPARHPAEGEHVMSDAEIEPLLRQAQSASQQGDTARATKAYFEVLKRQPEQPHAHNGLGMIALAAARYREAAGHFRRAAVADKREPALWINVARASREMGDVDGERSALDAALAIDQRHFMARLRKAELHEREGEAGAAAEAWSAIVALASQTDDLPAPLIERVSHGRAYVERHAAALGGAIEARISGSRDSLSRTERRRFDACLEAMLGRRRIYLNECHGVAFPFLPADEFFDESHFCWAATLEACTDTIRDEFRALASSDGALLRPYVAMDAGTPDSKWTPLDHSLDWGAMFLEEYGRRDPAVAVNCPATLAALEAIDRFDPPGRGPTIFFSLLKPKTRIPPHTGVSNMRAIVHLPLIVPRGCGFRVGGETRAWEEGRAFMFDDTIEHEAWNDSDELRAVLIFDVWNPHITPVERELVRAMFEASDASGLGPARPAGAGF
jgi:aspartate beta-hydroxylase